MKSLLTLIFLPLFATLAASVVEEKDPRGNRTEYHYDNAGNLIEKIGPKPGFRAVYTYDFAHRLIKKVETDLYDVQRIFGYRYDEAGNRLAEIDPCGNETTYTYDGKNRITKITYPDGNTIAKKYDAAGNVVESVDERGDITKTTYNAFGKPLSIQTFSKDLPLNPEYYEYDNRGNLIKHIDKRGLYTLYKYDTLDRMTSTQYRSPEGKLLAENTATYNAFHCTSKTHAEGGVTHFIYKGSGRECEIHTLLEGNRWARSVEEYDRFNHLIALKVWYGDEEEDYTIRRYRYDYSGNLLQEHLEDANGHIFEKVIFVYDEASNQVAKTRFPFGKPVTKWMTYDGWNRVIETCDPQGNTHQISYHETGHALIKKECDPLGVTTETFYDVRGREIEILKRDRNQVVIAHCEYAYDGVGNRTQELYHIYEHPLGKPRTYLNTFEYGPLHLLLKSVEDSTGPHPRTILYFYDGAGQLVRKEDAETIQEWTYDLFGRVIRYSGIPRERGTGPEPREYEFHYNREGQLTDSINLHLVGLNATQRFYDKCGRLLREYAETGGLITYTYDLQGRRTSVVLPDLSWIEYVYQGPYLNQIIRFSPEGKKLYQQSYLERNLDGKVTKARLPGKGGIIHYRYDPSGRYIGAQAGKWEEEVLFDSCGNLIQAWQKESKEQKEFHFSYDALGQLIEETGFATHRYAYDSLYNRLERDGESYGIGYLNHLDFLSRSAYRWDERGNLVATGRGSCRYDVENHLISYKEGDKTFFYRYDGLHRRLSKQAKKGNVALPHTYYLYDGDHEMGTIDHLRQIHELQILDEEKKAIALEFEGKVYVPIHDYSGNIRLLIDAETGKVAECYRYSAFMEEGIYDGGGHPLKTSTIGNTWRYHNRRLDLETGWILFGRRYYAPSLGRWTTTVPLDPNPYPFMQNNPLSHTDP